MRVLTWGRLDSSHETPVIPRPPSTYGVHCVGSTVFALSEMISGFASGSRGYAGCRVTALVPRRSASSFFCFAFRAAAPLRPASTFLGSFILPCCIVSTCDQVTGVGPVTLSSGSRGVVVSSDIFRYCAHMSKLAVRSRGEGSRERG